MVTAELYPFVSRYLSLDSGDSRGLISSRIHYIDEGPTASQGSPNGPSQPLLCVHGNPTWSFLFRNLIRQFRPDYRVIAYDHLGCGWSDKPDESRYVYRLERRVADLDVVINTLVPTGKLTLVLHDWGGMIGMTWAVRNPQRIGRLVLFNTAAFPLPTQKKLPWQIGIVRNTPLGPLLVQGLNLFCRGLVSQCVQKPLHPRVRAGFLAPYRNWKSRLAVLRFVQDIPLSSSDPSWPIIAETEKGLAQFRSTPTFIGWGLRDFVFDGAFLDVWQQHLPKAEIYPYADAHHLVLEDAEDQLLPLLRDFLRRHPDSQPKS
jgi:haloalkane dehalogenase